MPKKQILLVGADSETLADFRAELGQAWDVIAVANGAAATPELDGQACKVVVAALGETEIDGLDLLNRIQVSHPKIVRFILASEHERERLIKATLGAHQFLGKPWESGNLKQAVDRAMALEAWIPRNSIRELVARVRTLPTIPSLYLEVQALLKSPDATTEEVGAIIAKDMAMMTKLLQVINSAAFAVQRKITNPQEAVGLLGFETVSSMVMAIKVLGDFDKVKPIYFSVDRLWRHSTRVARNAKELTLMHTNDRALAETAFTAGLMHDLGKVVLAANFDEQYRGAQSLARKQQLPLYEVESEIFGATHGEMGAYLLGLWGMPLEVMEAAALHHQPATTGTREFTALTAVHVANAIEHQIHPDKEGAVASKIDEEYLDKIGVLENLPLWREAITTGNFTKLERKPKPVTESKVQNISAKKETSAQVPTRNPMALWKKQWMYVGIGTTAVGLLLFWLGCSLFAPKNIVKSETKTAEVAQKALTAILPVQEVRARTEDSPPTPQQPEKIVTTPASLTAIVTKPQTDFPEVKLQGIFYSTSHPQAIIDGKTVQTGDRIGEVTVLNIKESSITLAYRTKVKVLTIK